MNSFAFFAAFFCVLFLYSEGAKYSGRLDNLDIDEILRSERLLKNYFECLMGRGPCTPEGSELKRTIPDALKTECEKCTENQRKKAHKAIEFLIKNKASMYAELEEKYDPESKYRKRIRESVHLDEEETSS